MNIYSYLFLEINTDFPKYATNYLEKAIYYFRIYMLTVLLCRISYLNTDCSSADVNGFHGGVKYLTTVP